MNPDAQKVPHVLVTAAIFERDGAFLLARRLPGTHLEGLWEFPGGKCHPGESAEDCLRREIREELGAEIEVGRLEFSTTYHYPDRTIELRFFRSELRGEAHPLLGQEIRWVRREDLPSFEFPPADEALVRTLAGGAQ